MSAERLGLTEVAERLGVHYMTAYRYVRTGRLAAERDGTQWVVLASELDHFDLGDLGATVSSERSVDRVSRLAERLLDGDENGAWTIAQEYLAGGASPTQLYQGLFTPAMHVIGERWQRGEVGVADEHRASVVMSRLVGRSGPLFRSRGTRNGTIVVGAPAGEMHGLATSFAADILRARRFDVVDLGANVPTDSFVTCVLGTNRLIGVVISVVTQESRKGAAELIRALRRAKVSVPLFLGGAGVDDVSAHEMGADHWAPDVSAVASKLDD